MQLATILITMLAVCPNMLKTFGIVVFTVSVKSLLQKNEAIDSLFCAIQSRTISPILLV